MNGIVSAEILDPSVGVGGVRGFRPNSNSIYCTGKDHRGEIIGKCQISKHNKKLNHFLTALLSGIFGE